MQRYEYQPNRQNFSAAFGNLAQFHLGIWRIFIWEFGAFSFGNLADSSRMLIWHGWDSWGLGCCVCGYIHGRKSGGGGEQAFWPLFTAGERRIYVGRALGNGGMAA